MSSKTKTERMKTKIQTPMRAMAMKRTPHKLKLLKRKPRKVSFSI